ncbi:unnamed protein product [Hanseniaspora opuntiae]
MNNQFDIRHDELGSPDIEIFRQVDMSKLGTPDFFIPPQVKSKLSEKYLKVIDEKHKSLLKENGYLNNKVGSQQSNFHEQKAQYEQMKAQVAQIESFLKSLQPQQLAGMNRLYDLFSVLPPEEKKMKFQSMQSGQQQIITMVGKVREFNKNKDKMAAHIQQLQAQSMGSPMDARMKNSPYQNASPTQFTRMMAPPPSAGRTHGSIQYSPKTMHMGSQPPMGHQPVNEVHLPHRANEHMFSNEERMEILKKLPKMPELPKFEVVYVDPPKTYKSDLFEHTRMIEAQRPELKNRIPVELVLYEQMIHKDRKFMQNTGLLKESGKGHADGLTELGFSERESDMKIQKEVMYYSNLEKQSKLEPASHDVDVIKTSFLDTHLGYYQLKEGALNKQPKRKMHIPVRLHFTVEEHGFELKDTFIINGNDSFNRVTLFVDALIQDYDSLRDYLSDEGNQGYVHEMITDEILLQMLTFQDPQQYKESCGHKQLKIAIKLNILNKNVVFKDIFEWDILNPLNDAGEFAQLLGDELELDPELVKNIEFGILEQEQSYLRMLMLQGINANKGEVTNDVLKNVFIPSSLLYDENGKDLDIFRNILETKTFSPSLMTLNNHGLDDLKMEDVVKQEDSVEFLNVFLRQNDYTGENTMADSAYAMNKVKSEDTSVQQDNESTTTSRMGSISLSNGNVTDMESKETASEKDKGTKYSSRRTDKKINYYEGFKNDIFDEVEAPVLKATQDFKANNEDFRNMDEAEIMHKPKIKGFQELISIIKSSGEYVLMTFDDVPKVMSGYKVNVSKNVVGTLFDKLTLKDIGEMIRDEVRKGRLVNVLDGKMINNSKYHSGRFLTGEVSSKRSLCVNKYRIRKNMKYQAQKCFVEERVFEEENSRLVMKIKVTKMKSVNYLRTLNV